MSAQQSKQPMAFLLFTIVSYITNVLLDGQNIHHQHHLGPSIIFTHILYLFYVKVKTCGHPGDAQFADFHLDKGDDFVFGSQVVYACQKGYGNVYDWYS